ncbi:hypothetical protein EMPS_01857 [Entomortierella parvispora]|uniref:Enoyl reductase (ER) domain-containing protein n=1 Tax=Entomortierella parvispora TaxID=205924 RepID=A0A9P3H3Q0_9FUNG|nr:hypothetical protein EMPS_01857 [Entomortierella parvispora]
MAPNTKNTHIVRASHLAKGQTFDVSLFKSENVEIDSTLNEGEVLIRSLYLALDPFIRYSFLEDSSASGPLNGPVGGIGIGEVIESKNPAFPVKSVVLGFGFEWAEYSKVTAAKLQAFFVIPNPRNPKIALTEYLNVLGLNGLTSFAAVETLVKFKKDQVVFVSSAAGPVGSFFAILAKRAGAFVIGSAGSDEKIQYLLKDIGIDAAFNYKTQDASVELSKISKDGIDIYFDLVGGEQFDIALEKLKPHGQVVAIGNISESNAKTPYVTKNLGFIIRKALTINGFTAYHHFDKVPLLWKTIGPLVENGEIPAQKEVVIKGIDNAPQSFVDYLNGKYHGKVYVEVATL